MESCQIASAIHFADSGQTVLNSEEDFISTGTSSLETSMKPIFLKKSGASARIALTYDDPKGFYDTAQESDKYNERVIQIGTEIMYVFSQVMVRL